MVEILLERTVEPITDRTILAVLRLDMKKAANHPSDTPEQTSKKKGENRQGS